MTEFKLKLPTHYSCSIQHNPHKNYYQTAEEYLIEDHYKDDISVEEKQNCIESDEIWIIQLYRISPISFRLGIASTLEKALEIINND